MKNPEGPKNPPRPIKAYKNPEFLNSPDARPIRVLAEFIEPRQRFERLGITRTVVFFGSARTLPEDRARRLVETVQEEIGRADEPTEDLLNRLDAAQRALHMSRYYEAAANLAEKLTRWSNALADPHERLVVCSGGGPGIMEAANRGAWRAGGPSVGLNISLPHEQQPNRFQTPELSFEFHYFFIRKFWFVNLAEALVAFPGGFGTFDELFELLTLIQTGKANSRKAVVLYGSEYWNEVLDLEAFRKWGMISEEDLSLFRFCDDVDSAFEYLTRPSA